MLAQIRLGVAAAGYGQTQPGQLLQAGCRRAAVGSDQYPRRAGKAAAERQVLLTFIAGRDTGDQVGLAPGGTLDHALQGTASHQVERQAGAPANALQHIHRQPAQSPLAIAVADGRVLIVEQHPQRPLALHPAQLLVTQLQRATLHQPLPTPAATDARMLLRLDAGQHRIDQAVQGRIVRVHGEPQRLAFQVGAVEGLQRPHQPFADQVLAFQCATQEQVGLAKGQGAQGCASGGEDLDLRLGKSREDAAQLAVALTHGQAQGHIGRRFVLSQHHHRQVLRVGLRQLQAAIASLPGGHTGQQVHLVRPQRLDRGIVRAIHLDLHGQLQVPGQQPGIVGADPFVVVPGAQDVQRRVVRPHHRKPELLPLP